MATAKMTTSHQRRRMRLTASRASSSGLRSDSSAANGSGAGAEDMGQKVSWSRPAHVFFRAVFPYRGVGAYLDVPSDPDRRAPRGAADGAPAAAGAGRVA